VSVASKMHDKRGPVVHADALLQRHGHAGELKQSSRLVLGASESVQVEKGGERSYRNDRN